jgi:hypothetical protein
LVIPQKVISNVYVLSAAVFNGIIEREIVSIFPIIDFGV